MCRRGAPDGTPDDEGRVLSALVRSWRMLTGRHATVAHAGPVRSVLGRLGLRCWGMLVVCYIWLLLGLGALREIPVVRPGAFHLLISGEVRGWMWIGTAAAAAVCAIAHPYIRRPSGWMLLDATTPGTAVLAVMPMLHLASYSVAWAISVIPGGGAGYPQGWYAGAWCLGLVVLVVLVACIPSMAAYRASFERRPVRGES